MHSDPVCVGDSLHCRESQIRSPASLNALIPLVRNTCGFGELLLGQPRNVSQFPQSNQQPLFGRTKHTARVAVDA